MRRALVFPTLRSQWRCEMPRMTFSANSGPNEQSGTHALGYNFSDVHFVHFVSSCKKWKRFAVTLLHKALLCYASAILQQCFSHACIRGSSRVRIQSRCRCGEDQPHIDETSTDKISHEHHLRCRDPRRPRRERNETRASPSQCIQNSSTSKYHCNNY